MQLVTDCFTELAVGFFALCGMGPLPFKQVAFKGCISVFIAGA